MRQHPLFLALLCAALASPASAQSALDASTRVEGSAINPSALQYIESPSRASCKPRIVHCDHRFPDGRTDWAYPNRQGRCDPDNTAISVQAVAGVSGDRIEHCARCK